MNHSEKTGCWYSWPVIIIALFLFWPVGLFLLIKKATLDQKAARITGGFLGVLGIICYCMAGLGIVACMSEGFHGDDITLMLFLAFFGLILRTGAKKIKKNANHVVSPDSIPVASGAASVMPEKTKIVHCPYCGANSKIYGNVGECEYCGSPLSGEKS